MNFKLATDCFHISFQNHKGSRQKFGTILENRVLSESPQSLQEIGDERGVTREAVRQAEQRLLKKFRIYIEEQMPEAADYFKN